jgi:hypothetical protein
MDHLGHNLDEVAPDKMATMSFDTAADYGAASGSDFSPLAGVTVRTLGPTVFHGAFFRSIAVALNGA